MYFIFQLYCFLISLQFSLSYLILWIFHLYIQSIKNKVKYYWGTSCFSVFIFYRCQFVAIVFKYLKILPCSAQIYTCSIYPLSSTLFLHWCSELTSLFFCSLPRSQNKLFKDFFIMCQN